MYKQKFLVTTKIQETDGCGNKISPINAGEIRRGVAKMVDYADSVSVDEVTLKPLYVLIMNHSYYDSGSKGETSVAVFARREDAEKALREWVEEAIRDFYGLLSLDEEHQKDADLAVANGNIELCDEVYKWYIEEQKVNY